MKKIIFIVICFFLYKHFDRIQMDHKTKTCLVTGASSGIGREITKRMLKKGWKVITVSRRMSRPNDFGKKYEKKQMLSYSCDTTNQLQVHNVSEDIMDKGLKPTLFFLNAGFGECERGGGVDLNLQKKTFSTNYFGVLFWVNEWLNFLKRMGGGAFVATSSMSAIFSPPGSSAYSASKSAINSCFQSLRLQYLKDNIAFCIALPGPVKTAMLKGGENLPYKQSAKKVAKYVIENSLMGHQLMETNWFYSIFCRIINLIPNYWIVRIIGID